ncbi:MAG: DUF86 domain-containing protein [Planctomycetes bacterium]|nr:DUF86 domain-containing protein [Planctomycetota bacterium]
MLRRHLAALREAIVHLRRYAARRADDLRADADLRWAVERGLQLACQNVLDLATHVATAAGREASDYAGAIDALAELQVLPGPFASRLRSIAGFRNVLVHGYLQVDPDIVAAVLRDRLDELAEFADLVEAYAARC